MRKIFLIMVLAIAALTVTAQTNSNTKNTMHHQTLM